MHGANEEQLSVEVWRSAQNDTEQAINAAKEGYETSKEELEACINNPDLSTLQGVFNFLEDFQLKLGTLLEKYTIYKQFRTNAFNRKIFFGITDDTATITGAFQKETQEGIGSLNENIEGIYSTLDTFLQDNKLGLYDLERLQEKINDTPISYQKVAFDFRTRLVSSIKTEEEQKKKLMADKNIPNFQDLSFEQAKGLVKSVLIDEQYSLEAKLRVQECFFELFREKESGAQEKINDNEEIFNNLVVVAFDEHKTALLTKILKEVEPRIAKNVLDHFTSMRSDEKNLKILKKAIFEDWGKQDKSVSDIVKEIPNSNMGIEYAQHQGLTIFKSIQTQEKDFTTKYINYLQDNGLLKYYASSSFKERVQLFRQGYFKIALQLRVSTKLEKLAKKELKKFQRALSEENNDSGNVIMSLKSLQKDIRNPLLKRKIMTEVEKAEETFKFSRKANFVRSDSISVPNAAPNTNDSATDKREDSSPSNHLSFNT